LTQKKGIIVITSFSILVFIALNASAAELDSGPVVSNPTLSSVDTINAGKIVFFGASSEIMLKPGFHAKSGCVFRAKIGDYIGLDQNRDDGDGMLDYKELAYFGTASYDETTDVDSDGVPNFIEVQYGSDPDNANDLPVGIRIYEYDELGRIKKIFRF
jgi:hypothetical protein